MSRGPGYRQRAFLRALERVGPLGTVRIAPSWATPTDANNRRAAARRLVLAGRARAIFVRTPDKRGALPVVHLVQLGSPLTGDAWPRRSRSWVEPPPFGLLTLDARLQAPVLEAFTGQRVSVSTANRLARAHREAHREVA